ncbi:uncharacterized protein BX663DRAFT_516137 [Cokeromyces recurvatus]|uniref:uncharacterized protein n=1 Tax=Cokeromyces recurvatus TaxID=90255 RepID=UPI00221E5C6C|nr:uncharacterized protein BX663DRAFT_516137 [Cokeromyces recurvatus]KAI7901047.1 hypothetical protein BX663DRAFT_516137 [Cokeromyces recurvatus]
MQFSNIFKHHHKDTKTESTPKEEKKHHHHHHTDTSNLPKGFANDVMRSSNKPDTLYGFDDPTARRLGPVPSEDPTNTGA